MSDLGPVLTSLPSLHRLTHLYSLSYAGNGFVYDITGAKVPISKTGLDRLNPLGHCTGHNTRWSSGALNHWRKACLSDRFLHQ